MERPPAKAHNDKTHLRLSQHMECLVLIALSSNEGPGEPAHMRRLVVTFIARLT